MVMKKTFFFIIILLILFSCKKNIKPTVIFSDEINQYNYLDKPHSLKYIYDFEDVFSEREIDSLYKKTYGLSETKNLTIVIISQKKSLESNFEENIKITNHILQSKHNLERLITLKISKSSRKVGIAFSKSLTDKINDSLCIVIIEKILKPNFRKGQYYFGVNESLDFIDNHIQ